MKEADMMKKICPVMSRPRMGNITGNMTGFILCQGSACLAFGSRPTKVFLAKNGGMTTNWTDTLKLKEALSTIKPLPKDFVDDSEEITRLVEDGWKKSGVGTGVHFTKPGEPNCWCDAMPANAQCGYEAP